MVYFSLQICEEFLRISGVSLESTFISQLNMQTPKLVTFQRKRRSRRSKNQMMTLIQDPSASVEKRREVVLRCLIEYMGERQEDLISVHHSHDETVVHVELGSCPLKIYMCHQPDTIGIIIEGQPVVGGVPNLSKHAASCLDLPMPSTSSIPQNWCILLRYIRGSLWDWTLCVLCVHHPSMQISSTSCLR
ncbi:hypothetical protein H4Q32_027516 [Labeo rohita]|uniref:Uncharacterized protein n=1 Tax=Labeo rohita TaxID=84645 RepID=A0ABQ8KYR4_LABRO|nr:hypothetical protein H4Q32_027516 [Labeo rohita]